MVLVREETRVSSPNRFNVLLTEDRVDASGHWTSQLSRLLEPQGVRSYVVRSGDEAVSVVQREVIHAALVDLSTPRSVCGPGGPRVAGQDPEGFWLLEMFRRHKRRVPIVVINSRIVGQRHAQRLLEQALRLGAFSVVNRPVQIESLLQVIRRLVEREYQGNWPGDEPQ